MRQDSIEELKNGDAAALAANIEGNIISQSNAADLLELDEDGDTL